MCCVERVESFPPLAPPAARALILGSMPGVASLAAARYYAHPRNQFWPLIGDLVGFDPALAYPERLAALAARGIALWDVLASCEITGASDASIRNATPNDPTPLLRDAPIARIFTTGAKSAQLYRRLIEPRLAATGITIGMTPLPSTSPANASMRLPALIEAYRLAFQSAGALEIADETVTGL